MELSASKIKYSQAEVKNLQTELEQKKNLIKRLKGELRSKEQLQDSHRIFESIINTIPDIIYRLDGDGKITFVNDAVKYYGYDPNELIGKDIFELIYPEDREVSKYCVRERRTGGRRTKAFEIRLLTRDNHVVPFNVKGSAIYDSVLFLLESEGIYMDNITEGKKFIGTQGIARDITDRKITERKLNRLALIVEQVNDSIVITDLEGTIEYVNPAFEKFTGYLSSEVVGRKSNILKSGKHNKAFYQDLWQTLTSGKIWQGTLINKTKLNNLIYEEAIIFPVKDVVGKTINYAAVKRDITGEIKLEYQLRQAQKMEGIGQLAGGIAHDFNNYLTVINGYAELLMSKMDDNNPLNAQIQEIHKSGEQAKNLTRQLLAFSRKQIIDPEIISINQTISETEKMLRRLIGEDIELDTILVKEEYPIKADPGQIEQILVNLVINSRDAIYEKKQFSKESKILIETKIVELDNNYVMQHAGSGSGPHICLSVSDNGVGMKESAMQKVFDPFYSTKRDGKGTGLGLSTVYGIVKQNKGSIYVYSESGIGTTFKIYWPLSERRKLSHKGKILKNMSLKGDETIMLAEDDDYVRSFTVTALSSLGYSVIEASNGIQALKKLKKAENKVDLLITDAVMPKMGGRRLVEKISEFNPSLKVLYISGYTDKEIVEKGELIDGINFLQKPFSIRNLGRKIREILNQ